MEATVTLEEQIASLGQGDHVCMVYESSEEQLAAAVPFIRKGLARGECCVYIADDLTVEQTRAALDGAGIDTRRELERGALSLLTKREAYLRTGSFDPEGMIRFLEQTVDDAVARGFAGFRVTGEMTWALGCEHGCDRLIEYEARLNHFFPGSRALAICQYNRRRFSPSVIHDVLRTHPRAVIGDKVCPNIYYEPPESVLNDRGVGEKVEWMLGQLRRARETELRIQEFNAELERKVAEKTASLEEARSQLQAFCHSMAHDLRSPLWAIESYAVELGERHAEHLDEDGRLYVERLQKAARRVQALVTDLLQYASVLDKETPLAEVDVEKLLRTVLQDFSETPAGRAAEMQSVTRPGRVMGHAATLQLVVANLLGNAAKFVRPGEQARIRLTVEETPETIRILVADRGIGIPPQALEKIFRPFERLQGGAYAGSGMGLAIVKKAVERMSGRVGVESVAGRGSRFWLELPKASDEAPSGSGSSPDRRSGARVA